MNDLNVIDRFLDAFIRYIDSGFGLLGGDVGFLTSVLIGIDITLAGLFWAMGGEDNIIGRFIKKILYVGAFALILNSFSTLTDIIFRSFAGLGLVAGGGTLGPDDLLKPGRLAGTGFEAAHPLLEQVSTLLGFTTFFDNFLTIAILLIAWLIVIIAFFILAVQMFVTILEFKLTSLAGFVLVPFALWNRTSFLAERVLGNVVSSGVKVMVLAVIVGIGSGFFAEFTQALQGQEPDIGAAMSLMLASLCQTLCRHLRASRHYGRFDPLDANGVPRKRSHFCEGSLQFWQSHIKGFGTMTSHLHVRTIENSERLTVRIPQALSMIGLGRSMFYELVGAGEIETIKVGKATLVIVASLNDFVERRRARP